MSLDIHLRSSQTCPHCGVKFGNPNNTIFDSNITHNLNSMAHEAEIYQILWHPKENGIETAKQLIMPLERAITEMKANPTRFEKHNALNGWGKFEHFLPWLEQLLEACKQNPGSEVYSSI